jgi:DNA polymerase I-like protein with 3'-5' exonuclease and polymerase domains
MRKSGCPTRGHAKNFFYGFIFGAGDWKIGKIIGGDVAAGKLLKARYLDSLPGLKHTINHLTEQWRASAQKYYDPKFGRMVFRNGYIKGIDGRPILVESEHAILCYALQSDEAIQMSVAYVMLHKWAEEKGWKLGQDWGMLIWMHDEFQMEAKPEIAGELRDLACRAIQWAGEFLKIKFPHEGDGKIGRNWYECH